MLRSLSNRLLRWVATSDLHRARGHSVCKGCGQSARSRAINGTIRQLGNELHWQECVFCFNCGGVPCGVSDCDQQATQVISNVLKVGYKPTIDVPADFPVCDECMERIVSYRVSRLVNVLLSVVAALGSFVALIIAGVYVPLALQGSPRGAFWIGSLWMVAITGAALAVIAAVSIGAFLECRSLRSTPRERKAQYHLKSTGSYGSVWKDEGIPFVNPTPIVALIDKLRNAFSPKRHVEERKHHNG
ncbi:MAG: type IV secretion system protein [Rhodopirellula sp.]|nr:type IV secretion system protein [Rhodopirellula sp.]